MSIIQEVQKIYPFAVQITLSNGIVTIYETNSHTTLLGVGITEESAWMDVYLTLSQSKQEYLL